MTPDELEKMLAEAYPGRWFIEENEDCWELYAEGPELPVDPGDTFQMRFGHPLKVLKAPKRGGPFANWWPREQEGALIVAAVNSLPSLLSRIRELESLAESRLEHLCKGARENGELSARIRELEAERERAVLEEREACAKACDAEADRVGGLSQLELMCEGSAEPAENCAKRIRSRVATKPGGSES